MIFGGLGNDTIQGDGSIDLVSAGSASACTAGGHPGSATVASRVGACKDASYNMLLNPSVDSSSDGDDYIEGGGGDDVIFGNQGQDDIVGGSSNFFGLTTPAQRPDGADTIYGGSGTRIALDDPGDTSTTGHARDADVILGDNGKVIRLVSSAGLYLQFNYDSYGAAKVIPRAVALLDYSPRGDAEYVSTNPTNQAVSTLVTTDALRNTNIGGADFLHGESGDDIIHGQTGSDRIWGEGQSDDLYGESGYDWISGGTGVDGILGDDGLLLTSRNGTAEPLYGIAATTQTTLSLNGDQQTTIVNVTGSLSKQADVEPFYLGHNDVLYGGLGNDFLHGGAGDDAMSGAEALAFYYVGDPLALLALYYKPGDVLQHGFRAAAPDEFRYFDENNPWRKVMVPVTGGVPIEFLVNFRARLTPSDPELVVDDGRDTLFGDVGNDWIVGGTNRDYLFGGYGDDLLQADDDLDSTVGTADPLANDRPDARTAATGGPSFGDITFGGAGRDVQIANTITDRMYDLREFDSFFVPFSAFGAPTVNRSLPPDAEGYLYALSRALGADRTRGGTAARNGEPFGEIGLVTSADADWQAQSGSPGDPQPGNRNNQRDTNSTAEFGILTDADNGSTAAQLAVTDLTVTEANSGTTAITIVVTLSKASASTVTVTISTVAGTALAGSDYQTATATLTFAPGVTQRTFGVNIVNNTVVEPTEQFSVVLTNPAGASHRRRHRRRHDPRQRFRAAHRGCGCDGAGRPNAARPAAARPGGLRGEGRVDRGPAGRRLPRDLGRRGRPRRARARQLRGHHDHDRHDRSGLGLDDQRWRDGPRHRRRPRARPRARARARGRRADGRCAGAGRPAAAGNGSQSAAVAGPPAAAVAEADPRRAPGDDPGRVALDDPGARLEGDRSGR